MKFHPAVQISTWMLLVVAMQMLTIGALLIGAGAAFLWALLVSAGKFMQIVRRARWIMLSLLLIYAFSTPGQPLLVLLGDWGPSWEGMTDGIVQLTRLLAVIAGLAILLDRLQQHELISGIYTMLAPLQWVGSSRERVAVRVALTLHYAEAAVLRETHSWQDSLHSLFDESSNENNQPIELALHRFGFQDGLLLGTALLLLFVVV